MARVEFYIGKSFKLENNLRLIESLGLSKNNYGGVDFYKGKGMAYDCCKRLIVKRKL